MTNRWPFNVLMYMIDIAAFNAFALHRIKFPKLYEKQVNRERLNSLETLCKELLDPEIKIRSEKFSRSRLGCNLSLQESLKLAGHSLSKAMSPARNQIPVSSPLSSPVSCSKTGQSRKICELCKQENQKQVKPKQVNFLTRTYQRCFSCELPVCPEHYMVYCIYCKQK